MTIIHCLNFYLPQKVAGTEVYVHSLAKELQQKNIESIVVIPNYHSSVTETYFHEGIEVIKYAEPSVLSRNLVTGKEAPEGLAIFENIISQKKPALIHFHIVGGSNGISIYHVRSVKRLNIKMVLTFHIAGYTCKTGTLVYKNEIPCDGYVDEKRCTGCVYTSKGIHGFKKDALYAAAITAYNVHYDTNRWNTKIGTAIGFPFLIKQVKKSLNELSSLFDRMIVLTNWYQRVLELNGIPENKMTYISQGLPEYEIVPKNKSNSGPLKLIFIGRIAETKGLHLLIEAIMCIDASKVSLDIYGPADEESYFQKLKELTSIQKNIYWHGTIPPKTIIATIQKADCICIPSVICEMSPLIIQEAFAACVPVIASDVYGNTEQVTDNVNGWIFKFNDSRDLQSKISALIDNNCLIDKAVTNIKNVKPFASVVLEHVQLYNQLTD